MQDPEISTDIKFKDLLNKVPNDVLLLILRKLTAVERMKVGQTCKALNQKSNSEALWKLECIDNGIIINDKITNYKEYFFKHHNLFYTDLTSHYYVVGSNITVKKSSVLNSSVYEPEPQKKISLNGIKATFPRESEIEVVRNFDDAAKIANSKISYKEGSINILTVPVIFEVNLQEKLIVKEESKVVTATNFYTHRGSSSTEIERVALKIRFFRFPLEKITIKSFQISARGEKISIGDEQLQKNKCIIS